MTHHDTFPNSCMKTQSIDCCSLSCRIIDSYVRCKPIIITRVLGASGVKNYRYRNFSYLLYFFTSFTLFRMVFFLCFSRLFIYLFDAMYIRCTYVLPPFLSFRLVGARYIQDNGYKLGGKFCFALNQRRVFCATQFTEYARGCAHRIASVCVETTFIQIRI